MIGQLVVYSCTCSISSVFLLLNSFKRIVITPISPKFCIVMGVLAAEHSAVSDFLPYLCLVHLLPGHGKHLVLIELT